MYIICINLFIRMYVEFFLGFCLEIIISVFVRKRRDVMSSSYVIIKLSIDSIKYKLFPKI